MVLSIFYHGSLISKFFTSESKKGNEVCSKLQTNNQGPERLHPLNNLIFNMASLATSKREDTNDHTHGKSKRDWEHHLLTTKVKFRSFI